MSLVPPPPPSGAPPTAPPSFGGTSTPIPPPPQVIIQPLRPRVIWAWLGGLLMLGGIVTGLIVGVVGFLEVIEEVTGCDDCEITGAGTYELEPSGHGVFVLYVAGIDDVDEARDAFEGYEAAVTDPAGEPVEIDRTDDGFHLSHDGVDLVVVATFEVEESGVYQLVLADPPGDDVALRVGSVTEEDIKQPLIVAAAVGGGLFMLGLVLLLVTLVKRSKERKRRRRASGPPPGLSTWGTPPVPAAPSAIPKPWGTPPPPPPGGWNPPQ